jgi:hypothetical protein
MDVRVDQAGEVEHSPILAQKIKKESR